MPRRMNPTRKGECDLDLYTDWTEHLANASKDRLVIVQHKKVKQVLEDLGVKNVEYYKAHDIEFVHDIHTKHPGKEVILLFDASKPANTVCQHLRTALEQHGVTVNTRFRKVLFTGKLRTLEGFLKFITRNVALGERERKGLNF